MARWRRDDRLLRPLPSPNWPCGMKRGGASIRLQAAPGVRACLGSCTANCASCHCQRRAAVFIYLVKKQIQSVNAAAHGCTRCRTGVTASVWLAGWLCVGWGPRSVIPSRPPAATEDGCAFALFLMRSTHVRTYVLTNTCSARLH